MDRDVRVARRDHDRIGVARSPRGRPARAAPRRRRRRRARRPRPRAGARRTTPGTANVPAGVTTSVRSGSSVAGRSRVREPGRLDERAVTAESGSPARSACVRTRWRPMSRSPSRNQPSPPHSCADSSARHVSPARPQPRSASFEAGEGVEDGVEIGRDVQAEHLEVVADVADHRELARREHVVEAARRASRRRRRRRGRRPSPRDRCEQLRRPRPEPPADALEVVQRCRRRRRGSRAPGPRARCPSAAAWARNRAALPARRAARRPPVAAGRARSSSRRAPRRARAARGARARRARSGRRADARQVGVDHEAEPSSAARARRRPRRLDLRRGRRRASAPRSDAHEPARRIVGDDANLTEADRSLEDVAEHGERHLPAEVRRAAGSCRRPGTGSRPARREPTCGRDRMRARESDARSGGVRRGAAGARVGARAGRRPLVDLEPVRALERADDVRVRCARR